MKRSVLVTMLDEGGWLLLKFWLFVCVGWTCYAVVFNMRDLVLPIEDSALQQAFWWGVGAFMFSCLTAAILGMRLLSLRACPFSANLPGIGRRVSLELCLLHGALFVFAAAIRGFVLRDLDGAGIAYLPIMTALGFGIGMFLNNPRPGRPARWNSLPWFLALVPLFFAAEIAQFTSSWPYLALAAAVGIEVALLMCTGVWVGRRHRWAASPRQGLWHSDIRDGSMAHPGSADPTSVRQSAPRGGAAAFSGVRRTDWDWLRAMLHEFFGQQRTGLFGLNTFLMVMQFGMIAMVLVFSYGTAWDVLATGGSLRDALSAEPLIEPGLGGQLLGTAFLALVPAIVNGLPNRTPLSSLYPISRARRGRVVWLLTQAQDHAMLFVGYGILLLAGVALWAVASWMTGQSAEHSAEPARHLNIGITSLFSTWAPSVTAVVLVMPLARWVRLWMFDAQSHLMISSDRGPIREMIATVAVTIPAVLGSLGLILVWTSARDWPEAQRWMIAIVSIAAFFALRWWWFASLQRFHARCDL